MAARRILRNEEDARDAVQDALLSAQAARRQFRGDSQWTTWVHRIVINACLMKIRGRVRHREVSLDRLLDLRGREALWARHPCFDSAERVFERREVARSIRDAIARLPERYRTVVILRDLDGCDTAETARLLGVSVNCVKVRLHRARRALRSLLSGRPPLLPPSSRTDAASPPRA